MKPTLKDDEKELLPTKGMQSKRKRVLATPLRKRMLGGKLRKKYATGN
jgi:hypothetical protein